MAEFLQPLYALAIRVVLASHVLHTDDTSVKIRDAWRKLKHTGRFWPYVGDPLHPLTVFDYTTTHQRDGRAAFLKDYRGYLQADAFSGYDGIYLESKGRIIEVACWAHARRKFHESRRLDSAIHARLPEGYHCRWGSAPILAPAAACSARRTFRSTRRRIWTSSTGSWRSVSGQTARTMATALCDWGVLAATVTNL